MAARDGSNLGWQAPPAEADRREKQAYLNEVVSVGEQSLTRTTNSTDIERTIRLISGRIGNQPSELRSRLTINREKRSLREAIASISKVRAVDGFSSDNPALKPEAEMRNKLWKAIFYESHFPSALKKSIQWMVAGGYSYVSPVYRNTRLSARASKRICFDSFPITDCLPFQLPDSNDVQGAYAWTIIRFMPEFEAHAKFPTFQHLLRPVARRRYSGNAAKDRIGLAERFRADALGLSTTPTGWSEQYDEIRYTYIRDLRINTSGAPVPMGLPGSLESYIVPFVGQELPTGEFNQGVRIMRRATEEDCYLYPNLRLMISQAGMPTPMYDGPAFDWHGMFPLVRFSVDEWPWETGYSLAQEIMSVGETRQNFIRGLDQTMKARMDPALIYDKNAMNRKTAEAFDPYEERGRLGLDRDTSESVVRTALPETLLNFPNQAEYWLQKLEDEEENLLGMNQMQNIAKAKLSSASGDALDEKMLEAGPIIEDISHSMEAPMADLMRMTIFDALQYYSTGRVMQIVGPDGITPQTFDFDPSSLIASHAAGEDPAAGPSAFTKMQRVQRQEANFQLLITPGSLHDSVQMPTKLLMMQLQRSGFPIPPDYIAELFDIPNWGTLPGATMLEKWQNWKAMEVDFATKLQAVAASAMAPAGPPGAGPQQPVGPGGPGAAGITKPQPGRPPSGNKPPELVTKASAQGPRATITESR